MRSDDPIMHNHPWAFFTVILKGGYWEHTPVFDKGKFEQVLNLVRLPIQESEAVVEQKTPDSAIKLNNNMLPDAQSKVGFTI